MRNVLMLAGATLAMALGFAGPAAADLGGSFAAQANSTCLNNGSAPVYGGFGCGVDGGQVTILGSPFPKVEAQIADTGVQTSLLFGTLTYYFQVVGDPTLPAAPVLLSLYLDVQVDDAAGSAQFSSPSFGFRNVCVNEPSCTSSQLRETLSQLIPVGQILEIDLQASGSATSPTGQLTALSDPYIYIDPSYAYYDQVHLEFSSGITNAPLSGAPEPSAWALMMAGLGLTGAALRRGGARRVGA